MSVIGDRWSFLILRDCFKGVCRFEDFHERLGIGRTVLTERLGKLVGHGVLDKQIYRSNPPRHEYRLTQKGLDLFPVMVSLAHWGDVYKAGEDGRPHVHQHVACGRLFDPVITCSECGETVTAADILIVSGSENVGPSSSLQVA